MTELNVDTEIGSSLRAVSSASQACVARPSAMDASDRQNSEPDGTALAGGKEKSMFTIRDLAKEFGLTTRAIRFYEAKDLISPQRRGTTRLYTRRDRARLGLIVRGKNLGFSLEDIREFLDLYDADPSLLVQTRHLLGKVESAIAELEIKRANIDRSLKELGDIRKQCRDHLSATAPTAPSATWTTHESKR